MVQILQDPHGPWMLLKLPAALLFEYVAAIAKDSSVETQSIGYFWHGGASVANCPVPGVEFMNPAPGVAAQMLLRVVPSAVVHDGPSHELRARIVSVSIVVEKIGQGEASHRHRVTRHRPLAGKLIFVAVERLFFAAKAKIMGKIEPGQIRLGLDWLRAAVLH